MLNGTNLTLYGMEKTVKTLRKGFVNQNAGLLNFLKLFQNITSTLHKKHFQYTIEKYQIHFQYAINRNKCLPDFWVTDRLTSWIEL